MKKIFESWRKKRERNKRMLKISGTDPSTGEKKFSSIPRERRLNALESAKDKLAKMARKEHNVGYLQLVRDSEAYHNVMRYGGKSDPEYRERIKTPIFQNDEYVSKLYKIRRLNKAIKNIKFRRDTRVQKQLNVPEDELIRLVRAANAQRAKAIGKRKGLTEGRRRVERLIQKRGLFSPEVVAPWRKYQRRLHNLSLKAQMGTYDKEFGSEIRRMGLQTFTKQLSEFPPDLAHGVAGTVVSKELRTRQRQRKGLPIRPNID
jgi:hypothetical protein